MIIKNINNVMTFNKEINIKLTKEEQFYLINKLIKSYPNVAISILENLNKVSCPFPFDCNIFPCKSLCCNADVLDNGRAYRMS